MEVSTFNKPEVILLGRDGKLGNSFMERFESFGLNGINYSNPQAAESKIAALIEANTNLTFVIAVAAEYQVQVHEKLFAAIQSARAPELNRTCVINFNSVQDEVPKELEYRMSDIPDQTTLVGLHPHHGHPLTANAEIEKKWLITYAKRQDRNKIKEAAVTRFLKLRLEQFFMSAGMTDFSICNLDAAAKGLPQFRNGAELHDTLTAYSQALVHMIRMLVDDDDLFSEHFVKLSVDMNLSQAIVNQNPYAREGVFRRLKERVPDKNDSDFITKLKLLVSEFITEYESRFESVPPEILEIAKTPKFIELSRELRNDIQKN